jgi:hypothetical protein
MLKKITAQLKPHFLTDDLSFSGGKKKAISDDGITYVPRHVPGFDF